MARIAISAALAVGMASAASPGSRTSTQYRSYSVSGSTARSLVSYMRSHPFRGDHGDAVANIRPSYRLSVATEIERRRLPGAARSALNISFVMTLPTGAQRILDGVEHPQRMAELRRLHQAA